MGKKSQEWADMCGENCTKFMVSHPASAAYNGSKWDSKGVFRDVQGQLNIYITTQFIGNARSI
jgi:hypothetical protein